MLSQVKSDDTILIEAFVVGILILPIYYVLMIAMGNGFCTLFLTGAIFHILCELTNINKWYVDNYYKE
jgi:hypothetical protein